MIDALKKEYDYYLSNKDKIMKNYKDQYVAIKNCKIKHHGKNEEEVIKYMLNKNFKLGEFLVHLVSEDSDIIQRYSSRVLN